jgi:alkaline phosphatase D
MGDQFYESSGGYNVTRSPVDKAILDYLRKWYLHGWTWRELTRDRPSVSLPDDHDVYQGNLWGESGEARKTTQEAGGYDMPAEWVNVVYRTQTAHHPGPYDQTPARRGTLQYYGPLTYGRVSFAILADRQYKSGPEGKVPATGTARGDHVVNPDFDPQAADVAGLELLGPTQERFLREWASDWRGADMKAVISQTILTALPTTHGNERMVLRADYDTNAWPQTPRNRVVREIRKAFAFHIAGDSTSPRSCTTVLTLIGMVRSPSQDRPSTSATRGGSSRPRRSGCSRRTATISPAISPTASATRSRCSR